MNALELFITVLTVMITSYVGTFAHETGHWLAARLFGFRVFLFQVGQGCLLWRKIVGKTEVIFRLFPGMGCVHVLSDFSLEILQQKSQSQYVREMGLTVDELCRRPPNKGIEDYLFGSIVYHLAGVVVEIAFCLGIIVSIRLFEPEQSAIVVGMTIGAVLQIAVGICQLLPFAFPFRKMGSDGFGAIVFLLMAIARRCKSPLTFAQAFNRCAIVSHVMWGTAFLLILLVMLWTFIR